MVEVEHPTRVPVLSPAAALLERQQAQEALFTPAATAAIDRAELRAVAAALVDRVVMVRPAVKQVRHQPREVEVAAEVEVVEPQAAPMRHRTLVAAAAITIRVPALVLPAWRLGALVVRAPRAAVAAVAQAPDPTRRQRLFHPEAAALAEPAPTGMRHTGRVAVAAGVQLRTVVA
jgi:hypothetical protein